MVYRGEQIMIDFWGTEKFAGDTYRKLINYGLMSCDAFMFMCCDYYNSAIYKRRVKPFIKDFQSMAIKRRHDPQWPGTVIGDDGKKKSKKYNINFYKCDAGAYYLLIQPDTIFGWEYPYYPEDLCFFRHGYVWMTTVSHEHMMWINGETKVDIEFFKNLGVWEDATVENDGEIYYEKGITDKNRVLLSDELKNEIL